MRKTSTISNYEISNEPRMCFSLTRSGLTNPHRRPRTCPRTLLAGMLQSGASLLSRSGSRQNRAGTTDGIEGDCIFEMASQELCIRFSLTTPRLASLARGPERVRRGRTSRRAFYFLLYTFFSHVPSIKRYSPLHSPILRLFPELSDVVGGSRKERQSM
jgi:hypothetical protein